MENIFNIGQKPNENWHLEPPVYGEKYPRIIFSMDIKQIDIQYFILNHNTKIIFERVSGGSEDILIIPCTPCESYISPQEKEISFFILLTAQTLKDIEFFRRGDNLKAQLLIDKLYLISYQSGKTQRVKNDSGTSLCYYDNKSIRYLTVMHDVKTFKDNDHRLLILREQWIEKIIKPYSTTDRFILEIPYELPNISATSPEEDGLKSLKERLEKGTVLLRSAIDEYAGAKDHKKCITNIREISDLLHTIQHNKTSEKGLDNISLYGRWLVEGTGTGSNHISQEMIDDLFSIVDKVFNMSSKVPHAVTKGPRVPFEYDPDSEDAEMLLGVISMVYYWMAVKFQKSMKIDS